MDHHGLRNWEGRSRETASWKPTVIPLNFVGLPQQPEVINEKGIVRAVLARHQCFPLTVNKAELSQYRALLELRHQMSNLFIEHAAGLGDVSLQQDSCHQPYTALATKKAETHQAFRWCGCTSHTVPPMPPSHQVRAAVGPDFLTD